MLFWKKKTDSKILSEAEHKLKMIENILFPQYSLESTPDGKFFHVDCAVDSNLEAMLCDLQDGYNDAVAHNTINSVTKKLLEARKLLGVKNYMDKRAEYIILDLTHNNDFGDIRHEQY
jgi:hypothetical protein